MHFDDKPVSTGRDNRLCHTADKHSRPRAVARIDHDGQMGLSFTTGTALISNVLRVSVSNVRNVSRSHNMTS